MGGKVCREIGRMQSDGGVESSVLLGKQDGALGGGKVYPDGEKARYANLARPRQQRGGFLIGIVVEMDMAVSEHSQSVSRASDECGEYDESLVVFGANPGAIAGYQVEIGCGGGTKDTLNYRVVWAAIGVVKGFNICDLETQRLP